MYSASDAMPATVSRIGRLVAWIGDPAGLPAHIAHRLRHPRRKRKVVPLAWQEVASYEELLGSLRPSVMWLRRPESLAPNGPILFPEAATQEIIDSHLLVAEEKINLGLGCMPDVLISGQSLVGRSWLLYRLEPFTPRYVDDYLSGDLPVGDRKVTRKRRLYLAGVTALLTHWNSGTYGHWLLEGMPKLLLLGEVMHHLPQLRIAVPASLAPWVTAWIKLILPTANIETYDDRTTYLHCERLLMPTLLSDPVHHLFHPELNRLLTNLQPVTASRTQRTKLYVRRVKPSLFRHLSNQAQIEEIAIAAGLELVEPETLPLAKQIELFAHADLIVGEFGSAMHNAIFAPPGATVFCLNWIDGLQSRIAQLKKQRVGYLLPSNGVPVKYVEGAPMQLYDIDPEQFRKCLQILGL